MELRNNPIEGMDYSFKTYLAKRKAENARHMDGNAIPDYAYGMDYKLRKKLDSIPGLFSLGRKIMATQTSYMIQSMNQNAVCATPTMFPDVYEIGCECARRLGTAIPSIYITNHFEINAKTTACDDKEPLIIIHSALYERLTPGELKAVIGHECGHFQNHHTTYEAIADILLDRGQAASSTLSAQLQFFLTQGAALALHAWDRAAEVTADRAAMICADRPEDCYSVNAKLMYGAVFGEHQVDYEALKEQLKMQVATAVRLEELEYEHPSSVRRILAEEEFAQCRTYFDWRPEMKKPDSIMYSREECDERCKNYISVIEKMK